MASPSTPGFRCVCVTSQRPTAVQLSVVCRLAPGPAVHLVVVKSNQIEVHALGPDAVVPIVTEVLFGKIFALERIRLSKYSHDCLFVLTEKKGFCILRLDDEGKKLTTVASGILNDRIGTELDGHPVGKVDPESTLIGMVLQEGLLKVIPIDGSVLKEAFNLRMDEMTFIDICFVHGFSRPTLCVLYEDHNGSRHVKTYTVDLKEKELSPGALSHKNVDHGAKLLIPLPSPVNGVIVVGQSNITYMGASGAVQAVAMEPTVMQCSGPIDEDGSRHLLGDLHGALYVLSVHRSGGSAIVSGLGLERIGHSSIPSTLAYLDNGICFVGSCYGDSQLIRLTTEPDSSGSYVSVVETYANLGPIRDMVVIDSEREGQSRLVTCSGAYRDGSVRVVRSGIGLHEQASLDMPGVTGMWTLLDETSRNHNRLVASFIAETRVLLISGSEMGEEELSGLSNEQTVHCGSMALALIVQVTPTRVRLIDNAGRGLLFEYTAPRAITVATSSAHSVVIALAGGVLQVLDLSPARTLVPAASATLEHDVACLSLHAEATSPVSPWQAVDPEDVSVDVVSEERPPAALVAVGLWTDSSVRLLDLSSLAEVASTSGKGEGQLRAQAQARAVLLVTLGDCRLPSLLVGLGDGTLIVYTLAEGSMSPQLTKKIILGTQPISLTAFLSSGATCAFAACDRPAVVFGRSDKVSFSVVNFGEVAAMASFSSELFPECMALVTPAGLSVASVDDIQKIHIQTFHLGESPKYIAYSKNAAAYAVCTSYTVVTARGEESVDRVLVLDDAEGMSRAFTFELHPLEQSLACECFTFGGSTEYFVVGTAANLPEDGDPTRGRVLVFEIQSDKSLVLRVEQELKGAVFSLATIGNRLVVGVGSKVQVLKFAESEEAGGSVELLTECVVSGQILSLFVKARGDQVLLGDIMCSLSVLRWQEAEGKLREEARDFSANMIRAIEFIDDHHYLASDDCGNLLALSGDSGSMEGDRTRLGLCAEFHLGEYVNVLRRGVLNSQPRDMAAVNADAYGVSLLYGCVSGCIGAVIGLPEDAYQLLSALQKCLKGAIEGIGGLTHDDYRNFQNERRSGSQLGALDGDLLEQFLELSREKMEEIVLQLNFELRLGAASKPDSTEALKDAGMEVLGEQQFSLTVSDVIKKVEELASLH